MKFMRQLRSVLLLALIVSALRGSTAVAQQVPIDAGAEDLITVDASAPISPPETGFLHLGGTSSTGHSLQVNSRYLVRDGRPWLPVMGEIHFSRIPEAEWEDEILKMKAAGIEIISTYVFWIHHEEIEGKFDWTGQRDLRRFVQLCAKHGMYVWIRPGPWAHGEARNGGFPDWLNRLPNTRTNDAAYLRYVERFFDQIGAQVQGLMFKDGGPIIGAQLENEYSLHGPGRGAEHILRLKQLAIAAGIDPPLFSVTGWPSLDFPQHEVIPVSGGYPDGFWFGSQTKLPPSMGYLFNFNRELGDMGATVDSEDPSGKVDLRHYPYFAAEEGGGMAGAYHRRPVIAADDVAALTLTGIGSGINLYGYYMFHGGTNPKGALSTLQESQATGFPNDLPELTYDFNAPLGEFGQERESYRKTRMIHLFLNDYGSELAPMEAFAPLHHSRDAADSSTPRVAVRTDGRSGFVFVNNYVRQLEMPARRNVQIKLKLRSEEMLVPNKPIEVPADSYFMWPVNLAVGKATLRYSTAQLLTRLDTPTGEVVVFFALPGISPEFCFDESTIRSIDAPGAVVSRTAGTLDVSKLHPGIHTTIRLTDTSGAKISLLLISEDQAEQTTVFQIGRQRHLAMSHSTIFFDGSQIHLRSTASPVQQIALLPGLSDRAVVPGQAMRQDGQWTIFTLSEPAQHLKLEVAETRSAVPREKMDMGPYADWRKTRVAMAPPDSAFADAETWRLRWVDPNMKGLSNVLLKLDYTGDIGRLYSATNLVADNYFNGLSWEIGLKNCGPGVLGAPMTLKVLPMTHVAPIYLEPQAHALLDGSGDRPKLIQATLVPEYESLLDTRGSPGATQRPIRHR